MQALPEYCSQLNARTDNGFDFVLPSPGEPDGVFHACSAFGTVAVLGSSSGIGDTSMGEVPLHAFGEPDLTKKCFGEICEPKCVCVCVCVCAP